MRPQNATIARAWRVTPEILALAREPRYTVRMPLGDGRTRDFRPTAFEAREGFTVDEDTGQLIVSDDPNEVSYYWHGENGRDHLALTVAFGRVEGRVYTPAQRLTISTWGREHHYQRIDMGVLNRGVCAHSKIMRHVAALEAERREGRGETGQPVTDKAAGYSANPTVDVARAAKATPAMTGPEPDTELAKHQIKIDVLFYFTDVLAEALDDDSDPNWNYTPGNIAIAEALLGSRTQVYIDEINQSLRNSGGLSHIEFRRKGPMVRLWEEVSPGSYAPYQESPGIADPYERFAVHLFRLATFENSIISGGNHAPGPRRADHDADLAVVLVNDMGNPNVSPPLPVFGVAYMQRAQCGSWGGTLCGVGPGLFAGQFGMFGYSVVSAAPETANFTFSHEIGHLFGADHDVPFANLIVPPSFAHSFGHRTSTTRDIMADPWCGAWQADTCPRSQQFSNPEVYFVGTSTPAGTPGGRTCANPAPGACPFTNFTALTFRKNAQGHANIYPVGSNQTEPDLFWDGFEF